MIDPITQYILEREQSHDNAMKHGWPQTDWGYAFSDASDKFDQSYKLQKCIMKYKRYSREEQLCSLPISLKSEKKWLNWIRTKGIQLCKKTKEKQSDCFKFAKHKEKQAIKNINDFTERILKHRKKK